jgi:hypothetical protein
VSQGKITMHVRIIRNLLFVLAMLCISASSFAAIGIVVGFAPPPLPVYEQPVCPGDGYLWTPGYWGWGDDFDDYYWVPGTWVLAPEAGFLWTPPYWGWGGNGFAFYDGYWGAQVGFYGGINYGFGYFGVGFEGGRWDNGHFFYNRAVMNVNVTDIHNVYNTTVNVREVNHVSYNGGDGGITARATPEEERAAQDRHIAPVAAQTQHEQAARGNQDMRASRNQGKPPVAATARPGDFGHGTPAREAGGTYTRPANRGGNTTAAAGGNAGRSGATPGHVRELPPAERPAAPNTGDPKQDKKYQQQQNKLYAQQDKERQKVAKQQDKEDQKATKQNTEPAKQQVEQRHQQQTQQLQQKHQQQQQQMQQMQQRMQPARAPHKG